MCRVSQVRERYNWFQRAVFSGAGMLPKAGHRDEWEQERYLEIAPLERDSPGVIVSSALEFRPVIGCLLDFWSCLSLHKVPLPAVALSPVSRVCHFADMARTFSHTGEG